MAVWVVVDIGSSQDQPNLRFPGPGGRAMRRRRGRSSQNPLVFTGNFSPEVSSVLRATSPRNKIHGRRFSSLTRASRSRIDWGASFGRGQRCKSLLFELAGAWVPAEQDSMLFFQSLFAIDRNRSSLGDLAGASTVQWRTTPLSGEIESAGSGLPCLQIPWYLN